MAVKPKNYPNLDGLGLPKALTDAVRTAFTLIYGLRDQKSSAIPSVLSGTHAQRLSNFPASSYILNSTFLETDRRAIYQVLTVSNANAWVWISGEMQDSSNTLGNLPTDLGSNDTGFRYRNTFFYRTWEWSGSTWHYATGEVGAGAQLATSGAAPSGGLWQACDGSTVSCALDNATVANKTASNTTTDINGNNPMIEGGSGSAQQNPTVPTLSTNVAVTVNSHTTGLTIGNDTDGGTGGGSSGTLVALNPHTHAFTDPGHTHTTTITQPVINSPGEINGGLPLRVSLAWYMRR